MSGRELVILLLGLAIVAVVLRGLYVAINARRGQIKLAIDKNIPQDVDLESLELAELPGGGARVVTRSLEEVNRQNSALDLAESRAKSLHLSDAEDDSHIPVLMDAVELSEPALGSPAPENQIQGERAVEPEPAVIEEPEFEAADENPVEGHSETIDEDLEEDFIHRAGQEHSIGEDWEEDETEVAEVYADEPLAEQEYAGADAEAAPFEYDDEELEADDHAEEMDAMSSVAPDYEDGLEPEPDEYSTAATEETTDYESYVEDENGYAQEVRAESRDRELAEEQPAAEAAPFDADDSVEEFSMTAGERIGGNPPAIDDDIQASLFDDNDEMEQPEKVKSGRSLFSMFGRKSKRTKEVRQDEESLIQATIESDEVVSEIEEPEDILLQDEHVYRDTQLDIEVDEHDEPGSVEPAYEQAEQEEVIDELDQKRAASSGQEPEPEPQDNSGGEFEHSEVLVLNVTAKDGRVFSGDDLLHVLITAGLKFGDMNIFHKRLSKEHQGTVIFSVANMLNPGTFDLNNMDEFTTLGISFFLALPSPINNLDAFEQMLGVAQEIRDTLDGDLKDDHRNGMTGQTIEHYRQRVRDFELRRLKAVAARG